MSSQRSQWSDTGPSQYTRRLKKDKDVEALEQQLGRKLTTEELYGKVKKIDRGWGGPDVVGWGVVSTFGGQERDDGVHAKRMKNMSKTKMVRNSKGLWVKAKLTEDDQIETSTIKTTSCTKDNQIDTFKSLISDAKSRRGKRRSAEELLKEKMGHVIVSSCKDETPCEITRSEITRSEITRGDDRRNESYRDRSRSDDRRNESYRDRSRSDDRRNDESSKTVQI
eukprot:GHVH01001591.1.p1 GENE.GHVH01001591.1~~GHVH01001591.1.p1  ORF type:complete len:224 (-),score=38.41 GHVH01001591.1:15-686(-)